MQTLGGLSDWRGLILFPASHSTYCGVWREWEHFHLAPWQVCWVLTLQWLPVAHRFTRRAPSSPPCPRVGPREPAQD